MLAPARAPKMYRLEGELAKPFGQIKGSKDPSFATASGWTVRSVFVRKSRSVEPAAGDDRADRVRRIRGDRRDCRRLRRPGSAAGRRLHLGALDRLHELAFNHAAARHV